MYKTTQEERLELVLKLAKNADLFSEHFPDAKLLDGNGWSAEPLRDYRLIIRVLIFAETIGDEDARKPAEVGLRVA